MDVKTQRPRWLDRVTDIGSEVCDIRFPHLDGHAPTQDREWCEVLVDGKWRRVRFHDYGELYKIPGFYEELFYERLKCCSPSRVVDLLEDTVSEFGEDPSALRVFDVGAGNGMVGDELKDRGIDRIVGIDIIPEARPAADRDRPGVYEDYLIGDLTDLPESDEELLRSKRFNCLTVVAALGFGDIPAAAFAKAIDLIEVPGWLAFNIKEAFLDESDDTGFCKLIRSLSCKRGIQIQAYRRYRHRLSITGAPLYYVAVVAKKLNDLPDAVLDELGK